MIRFENVTKKYSGTKRPAIHEMDLEIARGEFVFLVGASGSGKSSCLRLILKEEKPSKGSIFVLGNDLGSISSRKIPYFRRNLGVVFQDFRLLPNKTVFENVAFTLQVIGKSRGFVQEAVPDVLKMVGLENKGDRLPHELSGGEQQRVAIARAVVNKPQILLADEPTGNLDPATSAGIMQILERINASGTTVLMATHEAGIVDKMQRRVIELVDGVIVRDELEGGYGTTGIVPELKPAVAKGESAKAARQEVAEVAAQAEAETQAHQILISTPAAAPEPAPATRRILPVQTGDVDRLPPATTGAINIPHADTLSAVTDHLSLAERLGLRPAADPDADDEQSVGPVK
jgi:cell division transport system ATP-binding protein